MKKAAEEGKIWEWRAFGRVSKKLLKKIEAYPMRRDPGGRPLANLIGQDLYLVSPVSEHNIKLRKSINSAWVLKFKLLLDSQPDAVEHYHESNKKTFRFPVKPRIIKETAALLNVELPKEKLAKMNARKFIKLFAQTTPSIVLILVGKVRSQYQTPEGWIEIADITFPKKRTQSISLHAFRRSDVEKMLDQLQPGGKLEVMNYLEACRRWA
jgi:hypothetical protein